MRIQYRVEWSRTSEKKATQHLRQYRHGSKVGRVVYGREQVDHLVAHLRMLNVFGIMITKEETSIVS